MSNTKQTMADLLKKYGSVSRSSFKLGEKVKARVSEIASSYMMLDLGGKSEGVVAEAVFNEAKDFIQTLKVGDEVTGTVIVPENRKGYVVLSLRDHVKKFSWDKIEKIHSEKEQIRVKVVNRSGGGYIVDVYGVSALLPLSHLSDAHIDDDKDLLGESLLVKIIEIDKTTSRLIVSELAVTNPDRYEAQISALSKVKVGELYEGVITEVTDFGVFVAIPVKVGKEVINLEGLVHMSEIGWGRYGKLSESFSENDTVSVIVLGNRDGKLSLSVKQTLKDPWEEMVKKYTVNTNVKGRIVKMGDFGAIVELEKGIEGLLHITKIPPAVHYKTGDDIDVVIEEVNMENKKISLGLVLTQLPVNYK